MLSPIYGLKSPVKQVRKKSQDKKERKKKVEKERERERKKTEKKKKKIRLINYIFGLVFLHLAGDTKRQVTSHG